MDKKSRVLVLLCLFPYLSLTSSEFTMMIPSKGDGTDQCLPYFSNTEVVNDETPLKCSLSCTLHGCSHITYISGICTMMGVGERTYTAVKGVISQLFITPSSENVALGKQGYSKSIIREKHRAAAALDGDYATYFHSNGGADQWLRIDLGAIFRVHKIKIYVRSGWRSRIGNINYYVSENYTSPEDHNSMPLFAKQVGTPPSDRMEYSIEGWMCGRHVILQRQTDKVLECYEVEVFTFVEK